MGYGIGLSVAFAQFSGKGLKSPMWEQNWQVVGSPALPGRKTRSSNEISFSPRMLSWVECVLWIQEIEFGGELFLLLSLQERKVKSSLKTARLLRTEVMLIDKCVFTLGFLSLCTLLFSRMRPSATPSWRGIPSVWTAFVSRKWSQRKKEELAHLGQNSQGLMKSRCQRAIPGNLLGTVTSELVLLNESLEWEEAPSFDPAECKEKPDRQAEAGVVSVVEPSPALAVPTSGTVCTSQGIVYLGS